MSGRFMLMTVHTLDSDPLVMVYMGFGALEWAKAELKTTESKISHFKDIVVDTFADNCSTEHYPFKYGNSDLMVEDYVGLAFSLS